jgi:hypothetical protein
VQKEMVEACTVKDHSAVHSMRQHSFGAIINNEYYILYIFIIYYILLLLYIIYYYFILLLYIQSTVQYSTVFGDRVPTSALASEPLAYEGAQRA